MASPSASVSDARGKQPPCNNELQRPGRGCPGAVRPQSLADKTFTTAVEASPLGAFAQSTGAHLVCPGGPPDHSRGAHWVTPLMGSPLRPALHRSVKGTQSSHGEPLHGGQRMAFFRKLSTRSHGLIECLPFVSALVSSEQGKTPPPWKFSWVQLASPCSVMSLFCSGNCFSCNSGTPEYTE